MNERTPGSWLPEPWTRDTVAQNVVIPIIHPMLLNANNTLEDMRRVCSQLFPELAHIFTRGFFRRIATGHSFIRYPLPVGVPDQKLRRRSPHRSLMTMTTTHLRPLAPVPKPMVWRMPQLNAIAAIALVDLSEKPVVFSLSQKTADDWRIVML